MSEKVVKTEIFSLKRENLRLRQVMEIKDAMIRWQAEQMLLRNAAIQRLMDNKKGQTRLGSLVEAIINVSIGFVVALITQWLVFPLFGLQVSLGENLLIGSIFTAVSVVRSYAVRRFFNWLGRKWK